MSDTELAPREDERLRRVVNRSAQIQAARARRRKRVAGGGFATVVLLVALVVFLRPAQDRLPGGVVPARSAATSAPTTPDRPIGDSPEAWRSAVLGAGSGGLAMGGGKVFVVTTDGTVAALQLATGEVAWTHSSGSPPPGASGRVDYAGRVVVVGGDGVPLHGLDSRSGNLAWTTSGTSPVEPVDGISLIGDLVVAADASGITAFARGDGELRWRSAQAPARAASGEADFVVAFVGSDTVVALEVEDGSLRWQRQLQALPTGRAAFVSGDVLVADADGFLNRLSGASGATVWRADAVGCQRCAQASVVASQPTVVGGSVVVGTAAGVAGVHVDTGEVLWRHPTTTAVQSSPVPSSARSIAVAVADPPSVVELRVADGSTLKVWPIPAVPGPQVVITPRLAIVALGDGRIHALRR